MPPGRSRDARTAGSDREVNAMMNKEKLKTRLDEYQSINLIGIGAFGHKIISLMNKMNIRGANTINVPDNEIGSFSKILSDSDLNLVFANVNNTSESSKARIICEKAKSSGSIVCLCTLNLKMSAYNILKDAAHTIITINRNAKHIYPVFTKRFVENIALPSLIGLDYADIKSILNVGKLATVVGTGGLKSKNKIQDICQSIFHKMNKRCMNNLLIMVHAGSEITLDEISEVLEFGTAWAKKDANVICGAQCNNKYKNKLELYCLITYGKNFSMLKT